MGRDYWGVRCGLCEGEGQTGMRADRCVREIDESRQRDRSKSISGQFKWTQKTGETDKVESKYKLE